MCIPLADTWAAMTIGEKLMAGATAFSAVSSITRGQEEKNYRDYQAAQASADAQAEREYGVIQAAKTRRAGRAQQSEARAALSASGVEVGAGTPVLIQQEIDRRAEEDALQQILYGTRKGARLDQEAQGMRIAGDRARSGGYRGAVGSILGGGAEIADGWIKGRPRPRDTSNDFLYDAYDSGVVKIG